MDVAAKANTASLKAFIIFLECSMVLIIIRFLWNIPTIFDMPNDELFESFL